MAEIVEYFWSCKPGAFVDKTTGRLATGASFTGTYCEWMETLVEVVIDVSLECVRRNEGRPIDGIELLCDPEVATFLQTSVLFKDDSDYPTLGMIGEPARGVLARRFPVRGIIEMSGTSLAKLVKKNMSGAKVLGTVTVLDIPEYRGDYRRPVST